MWTNCYSPAPCIAWLKYLTPFYCCTGHDPIANGVHVCDLAALAAAAIVPTAVAVVGFARRDLR